MAKLTLSVDERVISRAKQHAKRRGISLSAMVEAYLATVADLPFRVAEPAAILHSVRGVLKNAEIEDYRKYMASKYR